MNHTDTIAHEPEARTPWIVPIVETMAAGDAEAGVGSNPEGQAGVS